MKGVLGKAFKAFMGVLDEYTLADLISNRRELERLLINPGKTKS